MNRARILLISTAVVGLAVSGGVVAGGWQNAPAQDATPAPDSIGDVLRSTGPAEETAPAGDPAPAVPIAITPPTPAIQIETAALQGDEADAEAADADADKEDEDAESEADKAKRLAADTVLPRQRRRVAIIEAIDKITAESMRFEVEVGGRPVRFNQALIFTARACEVSAENELVPDAIAYVDVTLQPKAAGAAPRQIFRGWMFSSSPAISGLQHPIYDAWVVGCKA
ncbi:MAG: hypothetical protein B7Y86_08270 [Brevundimonas subvibrioides]|jgi:hypothetical protein|uniref:DUF2155 domain-containing protein n=1 Tax=Brevundimonas subvibrioides TaxID=74313 RepID=A0A258HIL9_9CAUL|nr:DUF2155 domain-containing protein [Brevundimonas subvibrioides]OYX56756.1 MAG: hypothetical protein B7Y86_08270 [Brevundimonas subvibrioides]